MHLPDLAGAFFSLPHNSTVFAVVSMYYVLNRYERIKTVQRRKSMTVQEMIAQMGERVFDQSFRDCLSATWYNQNSRGIQAGIRLVQNL